MEALEIKNLSVEVDGKRVLESVNLTLGYGEKHVLIGPNGAGKSSLAFALMGHPRYQVVSGDILLNGKSIKELPPEERAKAGLFLGFQQPIELPGISLFQLTRAGMKERGESPSFVGLKKEMEERLSEVLLSPSFVEKNVNEGSGGEKKRLELAQSLLFKPRYVIFDEIDSGVDLDAQASIAAVITSMDAGALIITHRNVSEDLKFDAVHIMAKGRIVASGKRELYERVMKSGFTQYAN